MRATMLFAAGLSLVLQSPLAAAEAPDLNRIDRQIAKEPAYNGSPVYALAVVGPEAKTRIWMVLGRSSSEAEHHDVLYADLDADGDLTEPAERFAAKLGPNGGASFDLPDLVDPAGGAKHTNFRLRIAPNRPLFMISLRWRGKHKMGGGYPEEPDGGYMSFARSPKEAPIVWINGDGPFRFQRWLGGEYPIGGEEDLTLFLGQQGVGLNSFCAFQEHVLPEGEPVLATLIYRDKEGREHRKDYRLKERC